MPKTEKHTATLIRETVDVDGQQVYGVRIHHQGTVYRVVPVRIDGRPALHHYSETAAPERGLSSDPAPLGRDRNYLAVLALTFLENDLGAAFAHPIRKPYPERRRPSDEALLRAVRDAGPSARRVLAEAYGVSEYTADDWIRRARSLPGANLPPAKRGRPPRPLTNEGTER